MSTGSRLDPGSPAIRLPSYHSPRYLHLPRRTNHLLDHAPCSPVKQGPIQNLKTFSLASIRSELFRLSSPIFFGRLLSSSLHVSTLRKSPGRQRPPGRIAHRGGEG